MLNLRTNILIDGDAMALSVRLPAGVASLRDLYLVACRMRSLAVPMELPGLTDAAFAREVDRTMGLAGFERDDATLGESVEMWLPRSPEAGRRGGARRASRGRQLA